MLSKFRNALLCYPVANINHEQPAGGISRYRRKVPPAHHTLKIQSFSSVKEKGLEFYSDVFETRGHKWRLCLYPNGKKDDNSPFNKKEDACISLYLEIVETDDYVSGWQVHVNFKLFVFDKKQDNYLTIQDANGLVRCFEETKKQWGFSQLISYKDFYDPFNGFLVYDSCAFGAEVFVINSSMKLERPSNQYPKQSPNIFTWDVKNFTKKDNWIYIESENFEVGGLAWTVSVYPKGYSSGSYGRKGILAMCLYLHHAQNDLPASKTISIKYKMRILNKDDFSKHLETTSSDPIVFSKVGSGQYDENIVSLKDLQQPTNGFIKNDAITVQVEVFVL